PSLRAGGRRATIPAGARAAPPRPRPRRDRARRGSPPSGTPPRQRRGTARGRAIRSRASSDWPRIAAWSAPSYFGARGLLPQPDERGHVLVAVSSGRRLQEPLLRERAEEQR